MRQPSVIPIENRLIVSLYDYSTEWARPYYKAGYPTFVWDKKHEGDIIKYWGSLIDYTENAVEAGYIPYGLLTAPPCDDFACSGARWFAAKDASVERCGDNDIADNSVDLHVILVDCVLEYMSQVKHFTGYEFKFWALENPVGRIERLVPWLKDHKKHIFDPCDYGDPYTKKTIIWGEFNTELIKTPVAPVEGSKMWAKYGGSGGERAKAARSATPAGFANAFFNANQ